MYTSMDLMMIELESRMFEKLRASAGSAASDPSVSFADLLDGAVGALPGESGAALFGALPGTADGAFADAGTMSVSDDMVDFIARHEGYSATAYSGADSWNRTIGYGHVLRGGENITALSKSGAQQLLRGDLQKYEASVNREFAGVNLTQGQFDALTSFAYNLGANIWDKTPQLTADIKAGAPAQVIRADMENCAHCGGKVLQGLVNRRDDEWKVYAYGDYNG